MVPSTGLWSASSAKGTAESRLSANAGASTLDRARTPWRVHGCTGGR
jgi:hypothetical protein